jgi:hypothetical protein
MLFLVIHGKTVDNLLHMKLKFTSGYYHLSFKYRQYLIKDMSVFRKIKINGEVPYDFLESYAFPYTMSFINRTLVDENDEPLKVYLEAGVNTITIEAVNYPYRQTIETIQICYEGNTTAFFKHQTLYEWWN